MNLTLIRRRDWSSNIVTIGALFDEARTMLCFILEPPWLDNHIGMSCIPEGTYKVVPHVSPKFGQCFILEGTFPREYILIHPGNSPEDTEGCMLPGLRMGEGRVYNSRNALKMLMEKYPQGFPLVVQWEGFMEGDRK